MHNMQSKSFIWCGWECQYKNCHGHRTLDITQKQWFEKHGQPMQGEKGFSAILCLDCGQTFNNTYEDHCCYRPPSPDNSLGDLFQ
jgi:hypothetical protein